MPYRSPRPLTDDERRLAASYWSLVLSRLRVLRQRWPELDELASDLGYVCVLAAAAYRTEAGIAFSTYLRHRLDYAVADAARRAARRKEYTVPDIAKLVDSLWCYQVRHG